MYDCEIEIANLVLSWKFSFLAKLLPVPGNEGFEYLTQNLQPFGLTARSVNLESSGSNLDDVALVLVLLDYKFTVRLTYSGIEAEVRGIELEQVSEILQILAIIYDGFEKTNPDTKNGSGNAKLSLHLNMLNNSAENYISERVSIKINSKKLIPEAAVFNLNFDTVTERFPTKITLAESLAISKGLFLEINYQIGNAERNTNSEPPADILKMFSEHYTSLLSFLELNLQGSN